MTYKLEVYDNGIRVMSGETEIYRSEETWSLPNEDALEAILEDANFGNPQREAMKAAFGLIERDRINDHL